MAYALRLVQEDACSLDSVGSAGSVSSTDVAGIAGGAGVSGVIGSTGNAHDGKSSVSVDIASSLGTESDVGGTISACSGKWVAWVA